MLYPLLPPEWYQTFNAHTHLLRIIHTHPIIPAIQFFESKKLMMQLSQMLQFSQRVSTHVTALLHCNRDIIEQYFGCDWQKRLNRFLLSHKKTPHCITAQQFHITIKWLIHYVVTLDFKDQGQEFFRKTLLSSLDRKTFST